MKTSSKIMLTLLLVMVVGVVVASTAEANIINDIKSKFTGKDSIYHFLVNAVIFTAILFGLQALLVQDKQSKTNNIAMFVSIAAGIILAWNLGREEYLWQMTLFKDVFHLKVFINFAVVAAVGFALKTFVLDQFVKEQTKKVGNAGIIIIIIVLAALVAYHPFDSGKKHWDGELGPDGEKYYYIWDNEALLQYRLFLLGDERCFYIDNWKIQSEDPQKNLIIFTASEGKDYTVIQDQVYEGKRDSASKDHLVKDQEIASRVKKQIAVYKSIEKTGTIPNNRIDDIKDIINDKSRSTSSGQYCYSPRSYNETKQTVDADDRLYYVPTKNNPKLGFGVLRGRFLFIAFFGFIIVLWLFKTLKIGEQSKWIQRIFAFYCAIMLANSGLTTSVAFNIFFFIIAFIIGRTTWDNTEGTGKSGVWKKLITMLFVLYLILNIAEFIMPDTVFFFNNFAVPQGVSEPDPNSNIMISQQPGIGGKVLHASMFGSGSKIISIAAGLTTLFILYVMIRKKKGNIFTFGEAGGAVTKQAWKDFVARGMSKYPKLSTLLAMVPIVQTGFKDQVSPVMYGIRYELAAHMNWMLRYEVFRSKLNHVAKRSEQINRIYSGDPNPRDDVDESKSLVSGTLTQAIANAEMEYFKWNVPFEIKRDEIIYEPKLDYSNPDHRKKFLAKDDYGIDIMMSRVPDGTDAEPGGLDGTRLLLRVLKGMQRNLMDKGFIVSQVDAGHPEDFRMGIRSDINTDIGQANRQVKDFWERYKRYSILQYSKLISEELKGAYMMGGEFPRSFTFAKPDAQFDYYLADVEEGEPFCSASNFRFFKRGDKGIGNRENEKLDEKSDRKKFHPELLWEVDNRGWVLDDIYRIKFSKYPETHYDAFGKKIVPTSPRRKNGQIVIRKVRDVSKDLCDPSVHGLMSYLKDEWQAFYDTLQTGEYIQRSRTWREYQERHQRTIARKVPEKTDEKKEGMVKYFLRKLKTPYRDYYYRVPVEKKFPIKEGFEAFDREALKDPGWHSYWGRQRLEMKNIKDIKETEPKCPFPGLSATGMSNYIIDYVKNRINDTDLTIKELNRFIWADRTGDQLYKTIEKEDVQK